MPTIVQNLLLFNALFLLGAYFWGIKFDIQIPRKTYIICGVIGTALALFFTLIRT